MELNLKNMLSPITSFYTTLKYEAVDCGGKIIYLSEVC